MELRANAAPAPLPSLPARHMAGPTPFSNWVIPGQVVAGAYPASMDDQETDRLLSLLLELGINTFVCLQAEVNIHIPDHAWRAGLGLRPYIKDAQRILSRAHEVNSTRIKQRKIDFLHLPIIDGSVTTDTAMSRLADDCCERVLRGEKMYIHCWGGHGRTGTLVATMLGRLYNLPYSSALRYTQGYHDTREFPQGVRSPQTAVQRAQVRRLLLLPSPVTVMVACSPAATNISSGGSSVSNSINKNIGLTSNSNSSSSSSLRDPSTPTRAVTSPGTPVKQPRRSSSQPSTPKAATTGGSGSSSNSSSGGSSQPFSWNPPSRPTAVAGAAAALAGGSGSSLFTSTALCRGSPTKLQTAGAVSSGLAGRQGSGSFDHASSSSSSSFLLGGAGFLQPPAEACRQQQRLAGTSVLTGSSLGAAAAAAAVRGSSANTALLRNSGGPRTPVQVCTSSKGSLLRDR